MSQVSGDSGREYEFKFLFPSSARPFVEKYLGTLLLPDQFSHTRNYTVNFDDLNLSSVHEKIDSQITKKKIRLRWYQDPGSGDFSDDVFFEVKNRHANFRQKLKSSTDFRAADLAGDLKRGRFGRVLDNPCLHWAEDLIEGRRFPVVMSSYLRKRYVSRLSGARVNIDYDLGIDAVNSSLFPIFCHGVVPPQIPLIVELKTKESKIPPELLALLGGGMRAAFSKYAYIVEHLVRTDRSEVCENECL